MIHDRKIAVAIAGCGQIARVRHAPEYSDNPNAVIKGFYDPNQDRARAMVRQYGGAVYATYDELLNDNAVDAVSICTPNYLHKENSIQALRSGKDVLCEKPMATSSLDAEAMVLAREETGRMLMLGHNQRLIPTHIRAKELIDSGMIGDIISIAANFKHAGPESWSVGKENTWFFSEKKARFGVLGDLGSHKIDLVRYLLGDEIVRIFASLSVLDKKWPDGRKIDLEDNAYCIFQTEKAVSGTISVSWTNYGKEDNSTIIYGKKGVMKIFSSEREDIIVDWPDNTDARFHVGRISTNSAQLRSGVIDAFVGCIVSGGAPPVSALDGFNTLACLEAAEASARSGQWTEVKNWR